MSHAILVRNAEHGTRDPCIVLAYDFEKADQAARFARRLAWSYLEHGVCRNSSTYWFRDAAGRHELTVT